MNNKPKAGIGPHYLLKASALVKRHLLQIINYAVSGLILSMTFV